MKILSTPAFLIIALCLCMSAALPVMGQVRESGSRLRLVGVESGPPTLRQLERTVFDLINAERENRQLAPVRWMDDIAEIARLHSEDMAAYKYFGHASINGRSVADRADACGVKKWREIGENIALNRGYGDPIERAVSSWMNSPGHRRNILNPDWKDAGIGIAVTAGGEYYFTQVFIKR